MNEKISYIRRESNMVILDYKPKFHKQIIHSCVQALRQGRVVAYPTDTSYGLAIDITNLKAIRKLYKVKQRSFHQPIHIVVPSVTYAKKIVKWNKTANQLTRKFWPGPLTIILKLKIKNQKLKVLSGGTNFIGLRMPNNKIALDLTKYLKVPITTPSANPPNSLGGYDSYSVNDIIKQFKKKKFKPDIIINAGKLPKKKPSTIVRIVGDTIQILRKGPTSEKQIKKLQ